MDTRRTIHRLGSGLLSCAAFWAWAGAAAQTAHTASAGDPLAPLRTGELVVWVVQPSGEPPLPTNSTAAAPPSAPRAGSPPPPPPTATRPTYHEYDAGSYGQTAGSFGKDAGSYGVPSDSSTISAPPSGTGYHEQTTGSFGQRSGGFGTTAGNYGEAAGDYGHTAGSFGVDEGRMGQTAGSFGNSLSTIAQAGQATSSAQGKLSPEARAQLRDLEQELGSAFPELHVQYASVDPGALQADLAEARGTKLCPDVLIAPRPGRWWLRIEREFAVAALQPASFYADGVTQETLPGTRMAILAHAPHRAAAQALAIWMSEAGSGCDGCALQNASRDAESAGLAAARAITRLLQGESLGDEADPAMAPLPPRIGSLMLASTAGTLPADTPVRIDLMRASARGELAAVALRVIASSSNVFALSHSLIVLRRDGNGRWRVLHVGLNLPPREQQDELDALMNSVSVATERHGFPRGIGQASPPDGDTRQPQPELWWDNGGGATLQVVEWQTSGTGSWSDPCLYLAPDTGARLRTQVTARFASVPATYRWRVWSVGYRGEMTISPWRTFKVVQ